jgi:hypothetical protein
MNIPSSFTYQKFEPYEWNNELYQIKQVVNGRIAFGKLDGKFRNMDGELKLVEFPLANTDVTLTHDLKEIPVGYLTLTNSNGGVIFDGTVAPTKTTITLRSTTAGNTATIFIAR